MKTSSLLVASGLVLFSTLLMKASTAEVTPLASIGHTSAGSSSRADHCGGEPCDAVARGFRAFFDRQLDGLNANGRACADCHMPTDSFQLSPASVEARFQFLQWRRRWNPDADDPLFRPIDADDFRINGDNASDFSNLRQNGLVRITFPLPPNIRLIDPATNQPSSETEVDVWRAVPTVNDVALTGPDDGILWPRGPNERGGYQLDGRFGTLQEQALAALTNHAQIQSRAAATAARRSVVVPARVVHERTCSRLVGRRSSWRRDRCPIPIAGSRRSNNRARPCSNAPAPSATAGPDNRRHRRRPTTRRRRWFDSTPSSVNVHGRLTRAAASSSRSARRSSPAIHGPTPSRCRLTRPPRPGSFRAGTIVRRTSSDPGRALLTGFVGGAGFATGLAPRDDWEKFDVPGLRGISRTAPYFINNSAATLEEMLDHYDVFFKRAEVNFMPGPTASCPRSRRPTA